MVRVRTLLIGLLLAGTAGSAVAQSAEEAREQAEAAREQAAAEREAMRDQLREAREQMREAARQVAEISRELGERTGEAFVYEFMTDEDRGMIGVVLTREGEDLKIASVTPDSPADEAGIEAGDVVVAVNGDPVEVADEPGDGFRTPEGLRGLKVGEAVTLTLSGDSGTREVAVEAGRRDVISWAPAIRELRRLQLHAPLAPGMPRLDEDVRQHVRRAMDAIHINLDRSWGRVELAPMNEDLGRYFGTDEGILVVSAPEDNPLGLKGGDVILKIGDREPNDPGHAFRIARSYGVGETLEVEVLRDGDRITLSHEIEDEADRDLGWVPRAGGDASGWAFAAPARAEAPEFRFLPGDFDNWEFEYEATPEVAQ